MESRNEDEALTNESWIHVMKEELGHLEKNLRKNYQNTTLYLFIDHTFFMLPLLERCLLIESAYIISPNKCSLFAY